MKNAFKTVLASLLILCGSSHAATYVYDALNDFESLDQGSVPYYRDNPRQALAIDAARESYRDVFARATTTFNGAAGKYDVTITALGEIDGECEYRFLVNGVVIGTAANSTVNTDYELQLHTFENVDIPSGAEISVESNALTNGLIPEGDGTAFARGRWRTLTLDGPDGVDTVDLSITAAISEDTPAAGEDYLLTLAVTNNSDGITATSPTIALVIPPDTTIANDSSCSYTTDSATCVLAELLPDQTSSLALMVNTRTAGPVSFTAAVSADQTEYDNSDNQAVTELNVSAAVPASVDLTLAMSSDIEQANIEETVTVQVTVENQHLMSTATAPVIGVALPAGLLFSSSPDCTSANQNIRCELPELPPQQNEQVTFSVITREAGTHTLLASVSANEVETSIDNNETAYTISVAAPPPGSDSVSPSGTTDADTDGNPSSSTDVSETNNKTTGNTDPSEVSQGSGGTGGTGIWWLLLVLPLLQLRKKTPPGTC